MIKLILLTGFLGAGKTTMLQEILTSYEGEKIGVIVNEFGEINIDAKLIERKGIQTAELSNGSIFCSCIKDKFVDSLIEMSCKDIDYLFIEASGLADPANMVQILDGIKNNILTPYDYKGSICVVDGENFLDLYELLPAITSQLEFCGAVIVNKGDLIKEDTLKPITEIIEEINGEAETYVTSYCKVNVKDVVDNISTRNVKGRDSSNTMENRPLTFILKGCDVIPLDKLNIFLKDVVDNTYRIKGFAKTDKGNVEISTVGKNINIKPWNRDIDTSEVVVISSIGFKMMSVLVRTIDKHLKDIVRL